jgi:translation initiation factor IF-2
LRKGSILVAGSTWCKVKTILDENSAHLNEASLAQAVQIVGWKDIPNSGDEVLEMTNEAKAKDLIELREKIQSLYKSKSDSDIIKQKRDSHDELYKLKLKERRLAGGPKFIRTM